MNALRVGTIALVGLLALQVLWHGWLAPPESAPVTLVLAFFALPLLPSLWIIRRNSRRGLLLAGIVSLFYFCYGVTEAWSDAAVLWLALTQIALTLTMIGALGWDARHYRRRPRD